MTLIRFLVAMLALTISANAQQPPAPQPSEQPAPPPSQEPPSAPPAQQQRHSMPADAKVYILWPPDGAVIKGAFWVRMALSGAGVAPAGVDKANTGHHHLLVDTDLPPLDQPIPNDHNHLHFGLGQTEARLNLPPGKHTLQLLLGDIDHIPHDPPLYSKKITITVVPGGPQQ